jgi:hypothetical protein
MRRRKPGWCWSGSVESGSVNSLLGTVPVGPPPLENRTTIRAALGRRTSTRSLRTDMDCLVLCLRSGLMGRDVQGSRSRRPHPYINPNPRRRQHRNQSINREHPNLAPHQVGDARLRDGKEPRRFRLVEVSLAKKEQSALKSVI